MCLHGDYMGMYLLGTSNEIKSEYYAGHILI